MRRRSDNSVMIEFAKDAVFSEDTTLAVRYRAERTGLVAPYVRLFACSAIADVAYVVSATFSNSATISLQV